MPVKRDYETTCDLDAPPEAVWGVIVDAPACAALDPEIVGLFVGRRVLGVEPRAAGARFRMKLFMSGPLAGAILSSLGDRQPEIDSFAAGLLGRLAGQRHVGA